eukprot:CAMPEP_0204588984 /NCGR_PEP_ID=MMETSP0661-20131031/48934_1 /ASSEMBLY_ACC=CAM_ASM_000606 /TAXON_ID=109239 /ORGANISM="Alexandrium margalefi, Strain AMGDE01CS-322" /LENGTH=73 /DNA_ID=CAMNT_0051598853 /DNA_START=73 /DNA_END=294 /DNA_ORIENTATION=+
MSGQGAAAPKKDDVVAKAGEQPAAPAIAVVSYICGNCGLDVELKTNDAVRCRECGYRILFKKRARKPMQYQAV